MSRSVDQWFDDVIVEVSDASKEQCQLPTIKDPVFPSSVGFSLLAASYASENPSHKTLTHTHTKDVFFFFTIVAP